MTKSRRSFLRTAGLSILCMPAAGSLGNVLASPLIDSDVFTPEQAEFLPALFEAGAKSPCEQIEDALEILEVPTELVAPPLNDDAIITEVWANEASYLLNRYLGISGRIHRNFSNHVAQYGDVVNLWSPAEFTISKEDDWETNPKTKCYAQNLTARCVPLKEHMSATFLLLDGEGSVPFPDLVKMHLAPAMKSLASILDMLTVDKMLATESMVCGTIPKYAVLNARERLNINKCSQFRRQLSVPPKWETDLLKKDNGSFGFAVDNHTITDTGFAFHPEALALVSRPLPLPHPGMGVKGANAGEDFGLPLRVIMKYDIAQGGTRVVIDVLSNVAILEPKHIVKMSPILRAKIND